MNILLIANELRHTCGVTNHLLHLSRGLSADPSKKIYIIYGGGNGADRFEDIKAELHKNRNFLHEKRNSVTYLSAINFLKKFIRENKIGLTHSHSHYAANIAQRASGNTLKTIQTNHGLLENKGRLKHFNTDKYIAVNEHIYDYIISQGLADKHNIKLIRCGIPVPDSPPQKNNPKLKIIAASRLIKEKGLDTYIKAVSLLDETAKQKVEFYIAGEGDYEKELKSLNKKLDAGIIFSGAEKNMYKMLAGTDALVFTSRSQSEGFPAIITEAGANNNLVISSRFSALGNIIEDNVTGLIFKQNDYNNLSVILKNVIENSAMYRPMAKKFYYKVKELYNLDVMINKHSELYQECLD
jgi:glycosyltransferase involved in cell wall biosynthesis